MQVFARLGKVHFHKDVAAFEARTAQEPREEGVGLVVCEENFCVAEGPDEERF